MSNILNLQLTITDTHITLSQKDPDVVLASALLDVVRTEPTVWREICGVALEAVAFDAFAPKDVS